MEINNKTICTLDDLVNGSLEVMNASKKQTNRNIIITSILLVIFVGLYNYGAVNENFNFLHTPVWIIMIGLLLLLCLVTRFLTPKSIKKNLARLGDNITYEYTFYDKFLSFHSYSDNVDSIEKYDYTNISKIVNKKKYLYVFIAQNSFVMIDKEAFNDEEFNTVIEVLKPYAKKKCGLK